MSLTSFVRGNADVREAFRREFEKPRFVVERDMVAPPLTGHRDTVGTAFDYLLRFFVQRLNANTVDKGYWVAELSVQLLADDKKLFSEARKTVVDAKRRVEEYVETGKMSDELVRSALLLARLDPIYRAGTGHAEIGLVDESDIEDMKNLISARSTQGCFPRSDSVW